MKKHEISRAKFAESMEDCGEEPFLKTLTRSTF